jgi:hypothetical protein
MWYGGELSFEDAAAVVAALVAVRAVVVAALMQP